MMKVLVGVDKSAESHMALRYTCHLLEHFDTQVEALYVKPDVTDIILEDFEVPFLKKKDPKEKLEEEALEVERAILNACQVCLAGKVPCEPKIAVGDPAEELIKEAETGNYDMIVLGSHGRSAIKGFLLGGVHTKVLHYAGCPVLIVREIRDISKVLITYRGTSCDRDALEFVAPLLERRKPAITVFHVQETELGESDEFAQACLISSDNVLKRFHHAPQIKSAQGDFVDETLKEIMQNDYDLVVLGAYGHQRSKFLRAISDEALTIANRTMRPVLVYRNKGEKRGAF